jgi:predicted RND superfamily exporter protein
MKGLGFGLERIGVAAIRHPLVFSIVLVVITAIAASFIPSVKFNGNVTSVVPKLSENFKNFDRQKRDFRDFSRDVAIIINSPRINTASGLEDLRFLQLELAITDGISSAISLFSIPDPDPDTGKLRQFFPNQIKDDSEAQAFLDRLIRDYPQASSLLSEDKQSVLLLVALDLDINAGNDAEAFAAFESLKKSVEASAPDDFEIYYSGLTPIGITILNALINDQVKLTLFGLAFGALIAMIFFRSIIAALICAVPPILTAIWSIGMFGLIGIPITYLTTILPTLALVLAYADGIVLYHRWDKLNSSTDIENANLRANLKEAVLKIGPASALTSLTTAFAISSFALSPSEALVEFAWVGVILVFFAFLAVIVGLPVLGIWLIKIGLIKKHKTKEGGFSFGALSLKLYQSKPVLISVAALASVIALFYVHVALKPDYRITDYLPTDSQSLKAEQIANDVFGGRSLIFFSVPVVEEGAMSSRANRQRLGEITDLLGEDFKSSKVFSLHSLWKEFDQNTVEKIASQLATAPESTRQGYISKDGSRMLVSLRTPSSQSITETSVLVNEIKQSLASLPYADDIIVTGFPVLLSTEFTLIINDLRTSLLVAVFLGIVLIGIATRSFFFAAVAAVPNLFPILLTELIIFMRGGNINVTEVVALTLAFGIAIDNAVHVMNVFNSENNKGKDVQTALRDAILEVAPALGASTMIICASTAVILTSSLPILSIIGTLIIAILIIALVTNLTILPANILTLSRVLSRKNSNE